jgi:endonuclease/exonuclease/phosphatase family metal-dependent hydrolase
MKEFSFWFDQFGRGCAGMPRTTDNEQRTTTISIHSRLLIVLLCAAFCSSALAQLPSEIRVISYNIHHGEGLDKKFDLERIAKLLLAERPHIVALQEVDQGTRRAGGVDQPAELARLMGMKVIFGRNIDFEGGGYGTAVLTSLPVRWYESMKLKSFYESTAERQEQRGVQIVKLGEGRGPGLLFLCTHLDYRPPDNERMHSAITINRRILEYAGTPAIIAGDFNALPDSGPIAEFKKQWKIAGIDCAQGEGPRAEGGGPEGNPLLTFPADNPDRWIDYVMVRPANCWQVIEVRVLDEPVASDHRPLLVVLRRAN